LTASRPRAIINYGFNRSHPVAALTLNALGRGIGLALAILRIYAGLFWLDKGIRQKLFDPTWTGPNGDCASVVASMTHAPAFFQSFLHAVVVPNVTLFSYAVEWGEALVGVSLFLGLLSRVGALGGMFLSLMYFLGNGAGSVHDGAFGFDATTFAMTSLHAIVPTGRVLGLDGLLRSLRGRSR
jgi:uncharacterized membrane protein YphA (DoxX/SURF4 family)